MPASLQDFLYFQNLAASVQQVIGGVPEDILPPGFMNVTDRFEGKTGEYTMYAGTRETARIVAYGSPARQRTMTGVKRVPVSLLHTFESLPADPTVLMQLQSEDSPVRQEMGRQTIARNLADFGQRFRNLRVCAIYSIFRYGAIYFDALGNLLPNSTGAYFSLDFQIPAGNMNQLDILGEGDIIDASWGTAATPIVTHVRKIRRAARIKTGYKINHAFYGANIPGYLLGDTQIATLIAGAPTLSQAFANSPSEIPQGLLGLQWHPVDDAFYVAGAGTTSIGGDAAGTVQSWSMDDGIVFTPDPSPDWWGFAEGSYPVPTTIDIVSDMMAALGNFTQAQGAFSYAKVGHNPPGVEHFAGDTFLPLLKNPWAVFLADVVP